MNLLFISNYAAPYRGNFIPALETVEQHLSCKAKVYYAFPETARNIPWMQQFTQEHTVLFLPMEFYGKRPHWRSVTLLRAFVRQYDITTVHTHFIEGNLHLLLLRWICPQLHLVANLHNHYIPTGRLWRWRAWLFRNTNDVVIGDSESVSESAYAIRVEKKKVITILNSIQFSRLDHYEPLPLKEGYDACVLMFGYPWHRKGVDIVARAVNILNERGKSTRLCIAQSGQMEATNQAIADTLGSMPNWVHNLPPTERLADYYNAVDIFVSAGREEGLSYSPIEAAYCQCDVVCSNIPGNPTDIPAIGLYPVEDVEVLTSLLEQRLNLTEEEKQQNKQQQKAYVYSHYNVEDWAGAVIKTYR